MIRKIVSSTNSAEIKVGGQFVDPVLLSFEQKFGITLFENLVSEVLDPVFIVGALEVNVVMSPPFQVAAMLTPAFLEVLGTPDIDLVVDLIFDAIYSGHDFIYGLPFNFSSTLEKNP